MHDMKGIYKKFTASKNPAYQGVLLASGRGVALIGSLVIFLAIGNLLSPEAAGQYYYLTAWAAILSFATLPGVSHGIVRAIARGSDPHAAARTAATIRLSYGLYGSLGMAIAGVVFLFLHSSALAALFLLSAIILPFGDTISECVFARYRGEHAFTRQNRAIVLYQFLLALLTCLVLFVFQKNSLLSVAILLALPASMGGMFYLIYMRKSARAAEESLPAETTAELKKYGTSLSVYQMILGLGTYADRIILWFVAGPVAVATYSIATLPVIKLDQVLPFEHLTIIKLAKRDITRTEYGRLAKIFLLSLGGLSVFAFAATACAPYILPILFRKYGVLPFFNIVIWAVPFIPLALFRAALMARSDHGALRILSIASVLLKIALMTGLGIAYGAAGVAVGFVAGMGAEALIGLFLVRSVSARE